MNETVIALLMSLAKDVVLPEVMKIIKNKQDAGLPITNESVMADFYALCDSTINTGENFLNRTK